MCNKAIEDSNNLFIQSVSEHLPHLRVITTLTYLASRASPAVLPRAMRWGLTN